LIENRVSTSRQPADTSAVHHQRRARAIAAVVVICAFAGGAALTWNRWGDLIIDTGRELDTPRQLAAGKMLYRDVRYWYGPFAPYLNAALYRIAGVSVQTLTTAGLFSAALLILCAYRICRLFTGRAVAAAGCIAIIFTNIFCQYYPLNIFNFVLPYSYPATYGIVIAIAGQLALLRHIIKGRKADFFLSCAAISLAALCKLEVFFAVSVMHGVFLVLMLIQRRLKLFHLAGYFASLILPAAIYGFFYAQIGSRLAFDNLFIAGNVGASDFTLRHSGLAEMASAVREMTWCLAGYAACFVPMLLASRAATIAKGSAEIFYGILLAACLVCGGIILFMGPFLVLRALQIALLFVFVFHAISCIRHRNPLNPLDLALAVLFSLGLAGLSRILLKSGAEHYGFYLSVPAMICAAVFWSRELPLLTKRLGGVTHHASVCGVTILFALAVTHLFTTQSVAKSVYGPGAVPRIQTPFGVMPVAQFYLGSVDTAITDLAEQPSDATVVVIPEGVTIGFLAGKTNPLPVHTFLPVDFCGTFDEQSLLERFVKANPDFIVLNSRDTREYGKRSIGLDYGEKLFAWVNEHYAPWKGHRSPANFQTIIFKRKQ
jgi:hypothetical protein